MSQPQKVASAAKEAQESLIRVSTRARRKSGMELELDEFHPKLRKSSGVGATTSEDLKTLYVVSVDIISATNLKGRGMMGGALNPMVLATVDGTVQWRSPALGIKDKKQARNPAFNCGGKLIVTEKPSKLTLTVLDCLDELDKPLGTIEVDISDNPDVQRESPIPGGQGSLTFKACTDVICPNLREMEAWKVKATEQLETAQAMRDSLYEAEEKHSALLDSCEKAKKEMYEIEAKIRAVKREMDQDHPVRNEEDEGAMKMLNPNDKKGHRRVAESNFSEVYLVKISAVGAKDLIKADFMGKSDPYLVVKMPWGLERTTKMIKNTLNPSWMETFEFITTERPDKCTIKVWDDDNGDRPDTLGSFPLEFSEEGHTLGEHKLLGVKSGTVQLGMEFRSFRPNLEELEHWKNQYFDLEDLTDMESGKKDLIDAQNEDAQSRLDDRREEIEQLTKDLEEANKELVAWKAKKAAEAVKGAAAAKKNGGSGTAAAKKKPSAAAGKPAAKPAEPQQTQTADEKKSKPAAMPTTGAPKKKQGSACCIIC